MRVQLGVLIVVLGAVAFLGGASRADAAGSAPAASSAPDRALACAAPGSYCRITISANAAGRGIVHHFYFSNGPFPAACEPICIDGNYAWNGQFRWTPIPNTNFQFTGWSGGCSGLGDCTTLLVNDFAATANFERIKRNVTVQVSGSGTVRSDPGGINCPATCSGQFDQASQVAFDATSSGGAQFNGWGGACQSAGQNARCVVTIPTDNISVTASFGPPPVDLAVTKIGSGSVTSAPGGIDCGGACTAKFPTGSQVTLTARGADADHPFIGWSGACTGNSPTCTVTMSGAQSVRARFVAGKVDALAGAFQGTWRRSRYSGGLVVTGTAENTLQLTVRLLPFGRSEVLQTFTTSVPPGPFSRTFPLPPVGVFPGNYTVNVSGTAEGGSIVPKNARTRMEAPREGVVSRAWITAGRGRPVTSVPRGTKRLVANFVYAAKPFIGSRVTVSWFLGGRRLGTASKIRWKPIVVTDVKSAAALPPGTYTCELRARNLVVYRVSARVR
jgi:hypothetical protein